MRNETISIIAEGAEDIGVLRSILQAFGFDGSEIIAIRPGLSFDATDKYADNQSIGTFQGVKNACMGKAGKRPDFERAFSVFDMNFMVIQLDTAEIENHDFEFKKPLKVNNENYSDELRNRVIAKINEWLDQNYEGKLFYAVTIEELESWCLTIFETENTEFLNNVKHRWDSYLIRNNLTYSRLNLNPIKDKTRYFETITKTYKFHKLKKLKEFAEKNQSFKFFVQSLETKLGSA